MAGPDRPLPGRDRSDPARADLDSDSDADLADSTAFQTLRPPPTATHCRRDMNCDGQITCADINRFVETLAGESVWTHGPQCPWRNADCTGDGRIVRVAANLTCPGSAGYRPLESGPFSTHGRCVMVWRHIMENWRVAGSAISRDVQPDASIWNCAGVVIGEDRSSPVMSRLPRLALRAAIVALVSLYAATGLAGTLRIVTYNILCDSGHTTVPASFYTVFQGISDESVNGSAQLIDVMTLQETTSNTITVDPIVTQLNATYGAGTYARDPNQALQSGSPTSGNGPNSMIYRTTTLQLIESKGIGTPSSSGAPRQPARYRFRPVGGTSANDFYVYVSHMKSGTGSSNQNRRNIEAGMLRTDADPLPDNSRILYTGDFNLDNSSEPAYITLLASTPVPGQAFDPLNRPGAWALNSAFQDILTESSTNLRYRDDFLLVTQNIMSDPSGLEYVAGSYHTFGVNGTTPINGTVNSPSNTALPGLPNRAAVLAALTTATDHLPVVADYVIPTGCTPQPVAPTSAAVDRNNFCADDAGNISLSATGGSGTTLRWFNDSCGGTSIGTSNPLVIASPTVTTTYYARWENTCGNSTCASVTVTVLALPVAPISAAVDRNNFCGDDAGNISLSATGGSGTTLRWLTGSCTGTSIGTGNPLVIASPTATTTYYARWENTCGNSTCASVTVTVNPLPDCTITPAPAQVCANSTGNTAAVPAGAATYAWGITSGTITAGAGTSQITYTAGAIGSVHLTVTVTTAAGCVCNNATDVPVVTCGATGACCSTSGTCAVLTSAACATASGHYFGDNSTCRPGNLCPASCQGDMNCDGRVTFTDIDLFVAALGGETAWTGWPCPWLNADANGDLAVTFTDIDPFVALIGTTCP
jgi:hypothetical protein